MDPWQLLKRDTLFILNIIFVVYFNYVLAGFDSYYYTSQQFLILVMYPFRIKNSFFKPTTATLFIQKSTTLVNRKGRIKILQTLGIKKCFSVTCSFDSKAKCKHFKSSMME